MYDFTLCPFCGNKTGSMYGMAVLEQTDDDGIRFCWVRCNKCNAAGPKIRIHGNTGTETMIRKSVDAWNVRHRIDNNAKLPPPCCSLHPARLHGCKEVQGGISMIRYDVLYKKLYDHIRITLTNAVYTAGLVRNISSAESRNNEFMADVLRSILKESDKEFNKMQKLDEEELHNASLMLREILQELKALNKRKDDNDEEGGNENK